MIAFLKKIGLAKTARIIRSAAIFLFDWCGAAVFFFIKPKDSGREIKKILIIRNDRIGDLVLTTPAIKAVRNTFPGARIDLLVSKYAKDIVVNNKNIDKLIIDGEDKVENNYDLAFALYRGIKQNYLAYRSGAKYRVGFCAGGGGFFLTHRLPNEKEVLDKHEVETCLELVQLLGCHVQNKELEVSITNEGEEFAEKFLRGEKYAILHPGARQEYIRWKKEGFAEVADRIIKDGKIKVILIGSRGEEQLIKDIKAMMKENASEAVGLKLTELVSVIKRAGLFIGNSSGPMHIAAAWGIPTVAIFGSRHPQDNYKKWGPWSRKSIVVKAPVNCQKCNPSDCSAYKCMELILAKDVLDAANNLLEVTNDNRF